MYSKNQKLLGSEVSDNDDGVNSENTEEHGASKENFQPKYHIENVKALNEEVDIN